MTFPEPPETPRKPMTIALPGGLVFEDAYTWLEHDDDPFVAEWQRAQNERTDAYFADGPDVAGVAAALAHHTGTPPTVPVARGIRSFGQEHLDDAPRPRLMMNEGGESTVVVDPNADGGRTLDWWHVSPTGRWVLYGLSEGGDEQSILHIFNADERTLLPARIAFCSALRPAWLPDESGFYFNGGQARDQQNSQKYLYFHRIGDAAPEHHEPLPFDLPVHAVPQLSEDGRWLGILIYPAVHTWRLAYLRDLTDPAGEWRRFVDEGEELCLGFFDGDRYLAVSKDGAPRGRVVSIPLATSADPATWTELVPQSADVLEALTRVGGHFVLEALSDARSRLTVHALDGRLVDEIELPERGVATLVQRDPSPTEPTGVTFLFGSITATAARFRYDLATGELQRLTTPTRDLTDAVTRRIVAPSADGTLVPALLVHHRDLDLSTPKPTMIYGYGGFNHRFLPSYDPRAAVLVESGGIYVHANLRGGGEFGSDWWHGGRMARKQNTFDDLYGVAELLIDEGITTSELLAVTGASNGGLLAGAAAVQRPDLFRAVVPIIPLVDLLRVTRDPFPYSAAALDYGDPQDPAQASWLLEYSPVHNVEEGKTFTATLVMCGNDDVRCPPWHSRKLVAAMQNATGSDRPILLRVFDGIGHGTGTTAETGLRMSAEPLAFILHELGLKVKVTAPATEPNAASGQLDATPVTRVVR